MHSKSIFIQLINFILIFCFFSPGRASNEDFSIYLPAILGASKKYVYFSNPSDERILQEKTKNGSDVYIYYGSKNSTGDLQSIDYYSLSKKLDNGENININYNFSLSSNGSEDIFISDIYTDSGHTMNFFYNSTSNLTDIRYSNGTDAVTIPLEMNMLNGTNPSPTPFFSVSSRSRVKAMQGDSDWQKSNVLSLSPISPGPAMPSEGTMLITLAPTMCGMPVSTYGQLYVTKTGSASPIPIGSKNSNTTPFNLKVPRAPADMTSEEFLRECDKILGNNAVDTFCAGIDVAYDANIPIIPFCTSVSVYFGPLSPKIFISCVAALKGLDGAKIFCTNPKAICDSSVAVIDTFVEENYNIHYSVSDPSGNGNHIDSVVKGVDRNQSFVTINPNFKSYPWIEDKLISPPNPDPYQDYMVSGSFKCVSEDDHIFISVYGTDGYSQYEECFVSNNSSDCSMSIPGGEQNIVDTVYFIINGVVKISETIVF